MEEAVYSRAESEDIKNAVEEEYLADVAEVYLVVYIEEEENIGAVENILEWCDVITDRNWRLIRRMTSLTMNGTGYYGWQTMLTILRIFFHGSTRPKIPMRTSKDRVIRTARVDVSRPLLV